MTIANLDSGNPVVMSNANGISWGSQGDSLTGSVIAITNLSAGTFSFSGSQITISNSNGISFGVNGGTLTASVPAGAIAGIADSAQTATSGTVVMSNGNNVTLGMSGSTQITATANGPSLSYWQNLMPGGGQGGGNTIMTTFSTNTTMLIIPLEPNFAPFRGAMTVSTFMIALRGSGSQTTASGSWNLLLGVYTLNASTLSLLNSVSTQITYAAVANNTTAYSGYRWLTIHSSAWSSSPVFTQTNYWLGLQVQTSNQTIALAFHGFTGFLPPTGFGTVGSSGTTGTKSVYPFCGIKTLANLAVLPTSIAVGGISSSSISVIPNIVFNNVLGSF